MDRHTAHFEPSLSPSAKWCQPGDRQDAQRFLVRFDDPDRTDAVFDGFSAAADFYSRATLSWNCWFFASVPAHLVRNRPRGMEDLGDGRWVDVDPKCIAVADAGWLPFSSAPRDGTKIDVWCTHPNGSGGVRFTDVQMRGDQTGWGFVHHYPDAAGVVHAHWEYLERAEGIFPEWKIVYWRPRPEGPDVAEAPPARRRLKRLEFSFRMVFDEHRAETPVGIYAVRKVDAGWAAWLSERRIDTVVHPSRPAAEKACQGDFEQKMSPFLA